MEQISSHIRTFDDVLSFLKLKSESFDNTNDATVLESLIARVIAGKADVSDMNVMKTMLTHSARWRQSLCEYLEDEAELIECLQNEQGFNINDHISKSRLDVLRAIENNGPDIFWELINLEGNPEEGGPQFDTLKLLRAYGERPCSLDDAQIMQVALNVTRYQEWRRNFDILQKAEQQAIQDQKVTPEEVEEFLQSVRNGWIKEAENRLGGAN